MTGILQILFDDTGFGDLACNGHPFVLTPNIDACAAAGRRYTKFLVTPICSTSRAMFMTGEAPQRWGFHAIDNPSSGKRFWLPPHTPTVGKRLRRLGWKTAHFGKTHWGAPPQTLHPARFGYDYFFGVLHGHPNAQFPQHGYSRAYDAHFYEGTDSLQVYPGAADDVVIDKFIAWVTTQIDAGQDWYAEVWVFTPHEPLDGLTFAEFDDYPTPTYTEAEQHYYGAIAHIDTRIGDVLTLLSNKGVLDETTIAIGSENGPEVHSIGQHQAGVPDPYRGWKTSLYMGGIAVPWIMRGPGFTPGTVDTRFHGAEDWMPTCLEIAGYDTSGIVGGLEGESLLEPSPAVRYICREYHGEKRVDPPPQIADEEWTIVKADADSKWKLYRSDAAGTGDQLFDIDADPGETTDVAASNGAIVTELQNELDAWVATWEPEGDGTHLFPAEDPQTELEAVTAKPEPIVEQLLVRCLDASDRTSKEALLNTALGYPRAIPCSHGLPPTTVSEYAPVDVDHPTQIDRVCLRTGAELTLMIDDPVIAGRLNAAEQTEFFEMCIDAHARPVP